MRERAKGFFISAFSYNIFFLAISVTIPSPSPPPLYLYSSCRRGLTLLLFKWAFSFPQEITIISSTLNYIHLHNTPFWDLLFVLVFSLPFPTVFHSIVLHRMPTSFKNDDRDHVALLLMGGVKGRIWCKETYESFTFFFFSKNIEYTPQLFSWHDTTRQETTHEPHFLSFWVLYSAAMLFFLRFFLYKFIVTFFNIHTYYVSWMKDCMHYDNEWLHTHTLFHSLKSKAIISAARQLKQI